MENYALDNIVKCLEWALEPHTKQEAAEKEKRGDFIYISLNLEVFLAQLSLVYKLVRNEKPGLDRPKFIDVGCGIGTKLVAAREIGFTPTGIDISEKYVAVAKHLLSADDCRATRYQSERRKLWAVECRDGKTFDFSGYHVIYFYCPQCDSKLEEQLEKRILETADVGAYVVGYNSSYSIWDNDTRVRCVLDHVWRKQKKVGGPRKQKKEMR